jgi:outer membrane protein assembly factor BamB
MATFGLTNISNGVFMNRYTLDNANVQSNEKIFTSANVSNITRKWARTVLGDVYAQTLYIDNVTIKSNTGQVYTGGVVIAATQRNFIYALNASNGTILWSSNYSYKWQRDSSYTSSHISVTPDLDYLAGGEQGVGLYDQYTYISPNIGITGTPVIDSVAGVLYFITFTSSFDFDV